MLHFQNRSSFWGFDGASLLWGARGPIIGASSANGVSTDPEMELRQRLSVLSAHALSQVGQYLGPFGIYRTESGWPLRSLADGAYTLDTYLTTYWYADGDYSLALQVLLSLTDGLNFSSTVGAPNKIINQTLTDGITLHETTPVYTKIAFVALTQAMTLHEAVALSVKMNIVLYENLSLTDSILTNTPLLSYVVNANTFALVKYRNFNFNSYANLEGVYYGLNDDGIYELDGDDDAGTAIDATVTLGKKDFGSKQLKSIPMVYIGARDNGDMILKVVTDSGSARYYKMGAQTSGDLKTTMIKVGKGLRSRYWQFELTNVNGSDLTLDTIAFMAVGLTRRIGGAS
jgi:hypothetical protein